jgi:hypothetical protein
MLGTKAWRWKETPSTVLLPSGRCRIWAPLAETSLQTLRLSVWWADMRTTTIPEGGVYLIDYGDLGVITALMYLPPNHEIPATVYGPYDCLADARQAIVDETYRQKKVESPQ